jgi:predicted dehydrogenase
VTASGLRVAIVGAGLMGRQHAAAVKRAGGTLVAVADPRIEEARRLAGHGEAVLSLDDLDARVTLDVVHICAPLEEHARLAHEALTRGAHVILEKPVTPDAATTAALLASAKELQLMIVPVHQFLFQPGVQRLVSGRDRFGQLVRCVFEAATAGAERTELDPDDLVADILPHALALFSRFAPARFADVDWVAIRPAPGELRAVAAAHGTTFEIVISTRGRPTHATLDLVGTAASAHADLFHGFAVVERGSSTRLGKLTRPFTFAGATLGRAGANLTTRVLSGEVAYPGLRQLVRRTHEAIITGSPSPIAAVETMDVALARDAILEAVATAPTTQPRSCGSYNSVHERWHGRENT